MILFIRRLMDGDWQEGTFCKTLQERLNVQAVGKTLVHEVCQSLNHCNAKFDIQKFSFCEQAEAESRPETVTVWTRLWDDQQFTHSLSIERPGGSLPPTYLLSRWDI